MNVIVAADELLFNENRRLRLQRLVIDSYVKNLPERLSLDQIVLLELRQDFYLSIAEECSKVRPLKLLEQPTWISCMLRKVSSISIKVEELVLVGHSIRSLCFLLGCATFHFPYCFVSISLEFLVREQITSVIIFLIKTRFY